MAHSCNAMLTILALLGGCAADAGFERPATQVPPAFGSGETGSVAAEAWWQRFGDPILDRLVARALTGNSDVRQAAARIRQARAQERIVRAGASPVVDASAQAGYTRISEHAIPTIPGSAGGPGGETGFGVPGSDFITFRTGFDASWETDLFGGQRHEQAAAAARTDVAIWSMRDARVTLTAEVGDTYLRFRTLQQRIGLADHRLKNQRELVALFDTRVRSGLSTSTELRAAERELAETDAAREALTAERASLLHALAILLGEPPLALAQELAEPAPLPAVGFDVPAGLPSELLLRRPDLRAAEGRLAASVSDVGAARAALFPKIGLTGALHLVSTSLADLLLPGSLQINAAARISLPILDGGRRRATVDLRRSEAEEAAEAYRARVTDALRDVEDALSRLEADRRRQALLAASEAAAGDILATAGVRHRNGLVPRMEVIEAHQALLAAEESRLQAHAAAAGDIVSLYKALGGGWTMEDETDD